MKTAIKHALPVSRRENFARWYQAVVAEADLAEESGVRGCMIIRPWGWGVWERMQALLDARIKATGHENCYFPIFIPLSYFEKEAEHVEGFAKEMAVVTHHRLKSENGRLVVDPEAKLEEPLVVRPTSETVIGTAMARWAQSWRDLPILINQWANVVRWEMRTRMFLRTSEFLWQEGHTAHATREEAMEETLKMLEVYRDFAEADLALPVVAGEKPEHERFPGADATFSIEAMMQDGKALQAGTSHFLGQNFARAQNIRYQDRDGQLTHAWTTSWGVSTRLIGAVIMTHGDDDGLRLPPQIAPQQIVVIPMLRDHEEDAAVLAYAEAIVKACTARDVLGERVRATVDRRPAKAANKRWAWIKKGAPLVVEVGPRDMASGQVSFLRRDALYREDGKLATQACAQDEFPDRAVACLAEMQSALFAEAAARRDAALTAVANWDDLAALFATADPDEDDEGEKVVAVGPAPVGWASTYWCRPSGAELDAVVERLKALKLTVRNAPGGAVPPEAVCLFTGRPAIERILIGRAY